MIPNVLDGIRGLPIRPAFAAMAMAALAAGPTAAATTGGQQLWIVSTRSAPHQGNLQAGMQHVAYRQFDGEQAGRWLAADIEAFRRSNDPTVPTTLFVHGNQISTSLAVEEGWALYRRMRQQAGDRPFRLVIWSWPSDRLQRRVRLDVQRKAVLSDVEGVYLAQSLADLKPGTRLSLVGYSLGTRVIAAAAQLLAGEQVAGRRLTSETLAAWNSESPRPVRAMLLAAAMDADWLMPGHRRGMALPMLERALVTRNTEDIAMRFYPRLHGRRGPEALGCVGPRNPVGEKLETVDVSRSVGRRHDWFLYAAAPAVVQRLAWYTFLDSSAEESPEASTIARKPGDWSIFRLTDAELPGDR